MTYSNITLESLGRDDVHTKLTCQASNVETNMLRTSVELDMKCKQTLVSSIEFDIANHIVYLLLTDGFIFTNGYILTNGCIITYGFILSKKFIKFYLVGIREVGRALFKR